MNYVSNQFLTGCSERLHLLFTDGIKNVLMTVVISDVVRKISKKRFVQRNR